MLSSYVFDALYVESCKVSLTAEPVGFPEGGLLSHAGRFSNNSEGRSRYFSELGEFIGEFIGCNARAIKALSLLLSLPAV